MRVLHPLVLMVVALVGCSNLTTERPSVTTTPATWRPKPTDAILNVFIGPADLADYGLKTLRLTGHTAPPDKKVCFGPRLISSSSGRVSLVVPRLTYSLRVEYITAMDDFTGKIEIPRVVELPIKFDHSDSKDTWAELDLTEESRKFAKSEQAKRH